MTNLLLSVRAKWCRKILAGEKKSDLRKVRPLTDPPLRCWLYETAGPPEDPGRGAVVGECVVTGFDEFSRFTDSLTTRKNNVSLVYDRADARVDTCLTAREILEYMGDGPAYGWRLSEVRAFDEPIPLSSFAKTNGRPIKRPPLSWCYVEVRDGD